MRTVAAAALACALLAACGGGRSAECSANRDCPSPQQCVANRCVSSGCGTLSESCGADNDCGLGLVCTNGCCRRGASSGCQGDEDCASRPSTPICDTSRGACIQCLRARDCGPGKLCQNNVCQAQPGCGQSADCSNPSLPVCDVSQRACVECLQGGDCKAAGKPICDSTHHCVAPVLCQSNAQCAKPTPVCNSSSGNCVGCLQDTDCPNGSICSPQSTCVVRGNGSCITESDCAGNAATPHCKGGLGGTAGTCVACTDTTQCPSGTICGADNTCVIKQCQADGDCPASSPRCDLAASPHACVACLASPDCPNGGLCQTDHTCLASCANDAACKSADATHPFCKLVAGGPNLCVSCRDAASCLCTADADCATFTPTVHCKAPGSSTSACVECTADGQCKPGNKCSATNTCKPICTVATQAQDCAAPSAVCKESPTGNACVACVKDADCNDATKICSSSNTCIAKPPACDAPPACTTNGNCCPAGTVCKTAVSPRQCVQCLASSDCTNGYLCDTASNTCKPPPVGAEGQACTVSFTCNAGLICIDEGGAAPVCRTLCDPYASSNTCTAVAAGKVCEWLGFDATNKLFGFCAAPNTHGALGAACDPKRIDSCEWNLICRATTANTGQCTKLCDPVAPSCTVSGEVCNPIVGAVASSNLLMGYCGPGSKWARACVRDVPSGTPTPAGDCGFNVTSTKNTAALYCAPSLLPAESPSINVIATCQYTPAASTATGGAASSCTTFGNDACRTGVCLGDGSETCYAGCNATADCRRDQNSYPCTTTDCYTPNPTFCLDIAFATSQAVSRVPSCVPGCSNESACAALGSSGFGRTCVAQPTHAGSSWQTYCAPVAGSGRPGAKCASGGDCESGTCFSAATLQSIELGLAVTGFFATDGFCLGSCLPPNSDVCTGSNDGVSCATADARSGSCSGGICKARCSATIPCTIGDTCTSGLCQMNECGVANGMRCDGVAALPLRPTDTGNVGVTGYPSYGVCVGAACAHDTDCGGYSKDAATPRVCAPYKQTFTFSTDRNAICTADTQCTAASYNGICNTAANNPNPGGFSNGYGIYGQTGKCRSTVFALQCAPSLGAAKKGGGAACSKGSDCRTGHCVVLPDNVPIEAKAGATAGICFGGCTALGSAADCAAGTCKASTYLGIAGLKTCQP